MIRKSNPVAVGFFTLAGIFIAFATVIYLGSVKIFSREEVVLFYFDESVGGLNRGSPVKFRGVPIGSVSDIRIRYDQAPESMGIPVFAKLDASRLVNRLGAEVDISDASQFRSQVMEQGLRGKLQLESIISGQLYIELDYFEEDENTPHFEQLSGLYKEIPTVPSVMARFNTTSSDVLAKISSIDIETINNGMVSLLARLNQRVDAFDSGQVAQSIVRAAGAVEDLASDEGLAASLEELRGLLADARALVAGLNEESAPTLDMLRQTLVRLEGALAEFEQAGAAINGMVASGSDVRIALNRLLLDLAAAARATEELATFLEQNPKSLISGRPAAP